MPYIPHTAEEIQKMLRTIGVNSTDDLFSDIAEEIRLKRALNLPRGLSEKETWDKINGLASKNKHMGKHICFLGVGAYQHYCPKAVKHILSRSEFYTAYTPYQPEISQGTLQTIFEYQTMICELTGMDAANASHYDGATALAEGVSLAIDVTKRKHVLISSLVHPEYRQTVATYLEGKNITLDQIPYQDGLTSKKELEQRMNKNTAAVVMQTPNFFGAIEELSYAAQVAQQTGALLIVCVDPISLGILEAPGNLQADVVVGEGQSLGLPLNFGGPYLGFMAVKNKYVRRLPGRIVGKTQDRLGNEGYVLTLQAREQHIRRERASSNICSNQALCALGAAVYLSLMGPEGIREVGRQCIQKGIYTKKLLSKIPGIKIPFPATTFKEFIVETTEEPQRINEHLWKAGIMGGLDVSGFYPELKNHILLCVTEMRTREDIEKLASVWGDMS